MIAFQTFMINAVGSKIQGARYQSGLQNFDLYSKVQADPNLSADMVQEGLTVSFFNRLLQRSDWFTQEKACRLLTAILEHRPSRNGEVLSNGHKDGPSSSSNSPSNSVEGVLNTFVNWLCAQLRFTYLPPQFLGSG